MRRADLIVYSRNLVTCRGDGRPKTGARMDDADLIEDGGLAAMDGIILAVGKRSEINSAFTPAAGALVIDAGPMTVTPGLIDSHTHPVYAGNRINEFILRAKGASYQEIHASGGGIQFTVDQSRKAGFDELYQKGRSIIETMLRHGTTTLEAKSGYGLDTAEEIRQLQVIAKLKEDLAPDIKATFMGAHSIPASYKDRRRDYIDLVINEMMPAVKKENLADFADVFCEEGAFTLGETGEILTAAKKLGFGLKVHAEEFTNSGAAVLGAEMGAVSVDHLLKVTDEDIAAIAATDTIMTLMPGTLFFLNYSEFAPARSIIDKGAALSLASDFNAGSCLGASMQMTMSLACIKMKMTPAEALNGATYNGAFAVGMSSVAGSLEEGKKADLVIFDVEDYRLLPYRFGQNLARIVIKNGRKVAES